ncbi:TIGR02679 family protein [Desulfotomaculum nigrificans]|uniref:TIGR02679 family protein n=1 Tax=Desulfotomaculum nigrificans TaxID=1565 RepID=UPI0001FADFEC|nr:TIGR02679 family protein [Desulfotomaculum nigrificans]
MLDYLRQPCFEKLFSLARKKIQSLNGLRGAVTLDNLSPVDQDLISGFLGKNCLGRTRLKIPLLEIDEVLKNSPLEMGLYPFLELYFNERILTNQEISATREHRWAQFFAQLQEQAQTPVTQDWLAQLWQGTGSGYRTLLALYQDNPQAALDEASICVKALDYLATHPGENLRIPVFAAKLTGDPHALDLENSLGRLLYYGLLHFLDKPETDYTAEGKRTLFREAGLLDDDVSSNVLVAGLRVCQDDPRFTIFDVANATGSPLILPLRFLAMPTRWQPGQKVYMTENPAVFSTVLDVYPATSLPPIICGSGQPSVAALTLLDQLVQAGCIIYYSGDFDLKGLEIAIRLAQRYKQNFRPWCYDNETYLGVPRGKPAAANQINNLRKLDVPWDKQLVHRMLERKLFVYQESFIDKLINQFNNRHLKLAITKG